MVKKKESKEAFAFFLAEERKKQGKKKAVKSWQFPSLRHLEDFKFKK